MKNILTILAIIALFAISCTQESAFQPADPSLAKAVSATQVKSGDVDEGESQEPQEEEGTKAEGEADETEGEGTEEESAAEPEDVIAAFVALHFPEVGIVSNCENENCHEVKLEDGTQINFNSEFEWTKVSCKHSTVYTFVPESIVPEEITAYVLENHPDNTIMDIKKTGFGYMVTLNNTAKIKFNKDFSIK